MPRRLWPVLLLLACAGPATAHVISMSSGFVNVNGSRVEYILRMPEYEIAPAPDRGRALLDHIRFTSGFETARRLDFECHDDPAGATFLCGASYQFSQPVDRLGVECGFYAVTVPNHIHMLRAERNGKHDQAILDSAFPSATLAFRPPTAAEQAAEQSGAGAMRVWTNLAQVLLLIALAVAARSFRELAILFGAFLAGECGGTVLLLRVGWQPPPRFAEAAVALTLAYLALEMLAFPKSGGRWLLALIFGGFEAMLFALFVSDSGYATGWVLTGAGFGAATVASGCALVGLGLSRTPLRTAHCESVRKAGAIVLGGTGVVWFILRLKS